MHANKFLISVFYVTGIDVVLPDGVKAKSKVMALSSHFDLPARAGVLEQLTYVGHDSCCYCDEHGETVKTGPRGHVMSFPFRDTATGHAKLRTTDEVKAHSYEALESNTVVSHFTAPFNNTQTLKFKTQLKIVFFAAVNHKIMMTTNSNQRTMKEIYQSQSTDVNF